MVVVTITRALMANTITTSTIVKARRWLLNNGLTILERDIFAASLANLLSR